MRKLFSIFGSCIKLIFGDGKPIEILFSGYACKSTSRMVGPGHSNFWVRITSETIPMTWTPLKKFWILGKTMYFDSVDQTDCKTFSLTISPRKQFLVRKLWNSFHWWRNCRNWLTTRDVLDIYLVNRISQKKETMYW